VSPGGIDSASAQHVDIIAGPNQFPGYVPDHPLATAAVLFEALHDQGYTHVVVTRIASQSERRRPIQMPPNAARPKEATWAIELGRAALQAGVLQVRPRQYAA